jgi:hypothetical protein
LQVVNRRILLGLGALAIAGIVSWWAFRGGSQQSQQQQEPANRRQATGDRQRPESGGPGPKGERPVLPGGEVERPGEAPFVEERRDPAFAEAHEEEARSRAEAAIEGRAVRIERVECRSSRCQVVIAGPNEAFDEAIAAMSDERGFYGWAREMLVTGLSRDVLRSEARATVVLVF